MTASLQRAGKRNAAIENLTSQITVIRPSRGWISLNLHDLWEYRELLYFLTWRDVKVRYKQTVLGAAWAIIQPFFTMVVFSLFFGKLARMPSDCSMSRGAPCMASILWPAWLRVSAGHYWGQRQRRARSSSSRRSWPWACWSAVLSTFVVWRRHSRTLFEFRIVNGEIRNPVTRRDVC